MLHVSVAQRREVGDAAFIARGLLWLGEGEWLPPSLADSFEVVDRKGRLFRRKSTDGYAHG